MLYDLSPERCPSHSDLIIQLVSPSELCLDQTRAHTYCVVCMARAVVGDVVPQKNDTFIVFPSTFNGKKHMVWPGSLVKQFYLPHFF